MTIGQYSDFLYWALEQARVLYSFLSRDQDLFEVSEKDSGIKCLLFSLRHF